MSVEGPKVRTLRIYVEPIDVEIEDDDGLQASALQMAFPGSSGLYYKGDDCKKAVKFDGKVFRPPGGRWGDDLHYFVTIGNRTINYPFGSYENASKQFERSVNAVQQMLNGSISSTVLPHPQLPNAPEEKLFKKNKEQVLSTAPSQTNDQVVQSIQERNHLLRVNSHQLTPIEQQFVDLAKISTGKDAIIESQREEIANQRRELEDLKRELCKAHEESDRLQRRLGSQEEELAILRKLSSDQIYMCDKVNDLTKRLTDKEQELNNVRNDMSENMFKLKSDNMDLQNRLSSTSSNVSERTNLVRQLEETLKRKEMESYEMELELKRLRTLAKRIDLESLDDLDTYINTMTDNRRVKETNARLLEELARQRECHSLFEKNALENAHLIGRNAEVEKRMIEMQKKLEGINDQWKENLSRREEEWNMKRSELELEKGDLRRQLCEMQGMFEAATRDVAETTRRLEEVKASRDSLKMTLDAADMKHQEHFYAATAALIERLREAEERTAEMAALLASFSSDAKMSRREVSDII